VIVEDVPVGGLGISRPQQHNVEGYAEKKAAREAQTEEDEAARGGT
jgi:bifunctional N-acetylglucosamine-1-phosphate-uridyltransferase/glucosamine-1-phosphate-acetyltransferase GlmU-like protein